MAEAVDVQKLRSYLTCSICLDNFDNPKRLTCSHLFCKCCLEDLVEFKQDGSALIRCPMRCKMQTFIDENETLDDLPPSYEIKGILEALEMNSRSLAPPPLLCTYHRDCGKDVTVYCCGNLMCTSCFTEHERTWRDHEDKTSVVFDKREGKLFVLCDEHSSKCTHMCEDNTFLCMYCNHRFHKQHEKDHIENQAAIVREALIKDSRNMDTLRILLNTTEDSIRATKKKLDDLLRERKLERLVSYIDQLNKEEERIRKTFQSISDDHIKQYPDSTQAEYYEQKLLKDDITLTIEKEPILDIIQDCNLDNFHLNPLTVSLPDSFDYNNEHVLGELKVNVGKDIAINNLNPISPTFKDAIRPCYKYDSLSNKLLVEIKKLMGFEGTRLGNEEMSGARSKSAGTERCYEDMRRDLLKSLNKDEYDCDDGISPSSSSHEICFALSVNRTSKDVALKKENLYLRRNGYKSPLFPVTKTYGSVENNRPSSSGRKSSSDHFALPSRYDASKYFNASERYRVDITPPQTDDPSTPVTSSRFSDIRKRYSSTTNIEISTDPVPRRSRPTSRPQSYHHASFSDTNGGEHHRHNTRFFTYESSPRPADHIQSSGAEDEVIHIKSRPSRTKSIPFCPTSIEDLKVGMKVSVNRSRPMLSRGTVKWTGTLPVHTGDYVGIELDIESGKHDGLFNGVQYFRCKPDRGIFVKLSKVIMAWK